MTLAKDLLDVANNRPKIYKKGALDYSPQETVSGEAIGITDISPIEHNMGVSVRKMSLIPYPYETPSTDTKGIKITVNEDGSILLNGTGTNSTVNNINLFWDNPITLPAGNYTIGGVVSNDCYIVLQNVTDGGYSYTQTKNITVSYAKDKQIRLCIQFVAKAVLNNVLIKPFIVKTEDFSNTYPPYVEDISTVKLYKQGKNWFNNDTSLIKKVNYIGNDGVERKKNGYELSLPVGTYTINAIPNTTYSDIYIYGVVTDENNNIKISVNTVLGDHTQSLTFKVEKGDIIKIYDGINNQSITASQNRFKKFDIQLELGTKATEYEPYIEPVTYDVPTNGTVEGVNSIYPSVSLYTDTSGAVIDCTYYQDGRKVKENLTDMILSLGGVINE